MKVAPLVGAWIEISASTTCGCSNASLPSWERGLKLHGSHVSAVRSLSRPSWERGLKYYLFMVRP